MVTIFHLSDLHIEESTFWHNLKESYLDEARKVGSAKQRGEKLLVLTGDFHNYGEDGYTLAEEFLSELITALDIEKERDVFLVPGNHDVGNDSALGDDGKARRDKAAAWLKEHDTSEYDDEGRGYSDYVGMRLEAFAPYCRFARALGAYPADGEPYLPARVHVRNWRGKLNFLHLNTALTATGDPVRSEQADILTATGRTIWNDADKSLPVLALGHNNFFDLVEDHEIRQTHRKSLTPTLKRYGVCAYLCGDVHAEEYETSHKWIYLDSGEDYDSEKIRNAVGVKGAVSERDNKRGKDCDVGFYLHEWDEKTGRVSMTLMRWESQWSQGEFRSVPAGSYFIPRPTGTSPASPSAPADGAPPPETPREDRARALWLAGRDDEALNLLGEAQQTTAKQYISKTQLKIDILKSKGLNRETIPKIRACYEECAALAKAHRVSVYVLYDYASFLWKQNDYPPAIEAARWLLDYERQERAPEENQAALENLLGNLLCKNNQMQEAEEQYREALTIRRRLAETNPAAYEPDVAMTCNNLAALCYSTNRMAEAEEQYREALAIYRRLAETNPAAYEPDVAMTCNNLAALCYSTNRMAEAEEQYREALDAYRRLAETNPATYEPYVAGTCNNLGELYRVWNRMREAEPLYRAALELYRRLAETNPAAYEPYVATTCNNLAILYAQTNQQEKAEKYFREALDAYRRLVETNPAAYEPYVAGTCFNYGLLLLKDASRKDEAKPLFEEAARLWDKYPHFSDRARRAHSELDKLSASRDKPFGWFRRKDKK